MLKTVKRGFIFLVASVLLWTSVYSPAFAALLLPSELQVIGEQAFYGDTSVKGLVTVGRQIREIGADAFTGSGVYALDLGSSVSKVGRQQLNHAAYAYVRGANTEFSVGALQGVKALIGTPGSTAEYHAPTIGAEFISTSSLRLANGWYFQLANNGVRLLFPKDSESVGRIVRVPEYVDGLTVTSVSDYAFMGCSSLRSIELPGNLQVPSDALTDCANASVSYYGGIHPKAINGVDSVQDGSGLISMTFSLDGSMVAGTDQIYVYEVFADGSEKLAALSDDDTVQILTGEGVHSYRAVASARQNNGQTVWGDSYSFTAKVRAFWSSQPAAPQVMQTGEHELRVQWTWIYPAQSARLYEINQNGETTFIGAYAGDSLAELYNVTNGEHQYVLHLLGEEDGVVYESAASKAALVEVFPLDQLMPAPSPVCGDPDRPFATDPQNAPLYAADEAIALSWLDVPGASSYGYTVEQVCDGMYAQVEAGEVQSNGLRLTGSTYGGGTGETLYRLGLHTIGNNMAGARNYTFFRIWVADEGLTVNGAATVRWDRSNSASGSRTFTVQSELDWNITAKPDWITADVNGDQLTLTMAELKTGLVRQTLTGEVVLSNGHNSVSITVNHSNMIKAPALNYNGMVLSTDVSNPTPISKGGFTLGILANRASQMTINFYKKTGSTYNYSFGWWTSNDTLSVSKDVVTDTVYRVTITGYIERQTAYSQGDDCLRTDYYVIFTDEGSFLNLEGSTAYEYTDYDSSGTLNLYTSDTNWSAVSDASWLSLTRKSNESGYSTVRISFSETNLTGSDRTGHITVTDSSGNQTMTITATQLDKTPRVVYPMLSTSENSPTILTYNYLTIRFHGKTLDWGVKSGSGYTDTCVSSMSSFTDRTRVLCNTEGNITFNKNIVYRIKITDEEGNTASYYVKANSETASDLFFSDSEVSIPASGGSNSVTMYANASWTASSSQSWLSVSPANGGSSSNSQKLTFSAGANETGATRSATVTVKLGSVLSHTITVTQSGEQFLTIYMDDIPIDHNAECAHLTGNAQSATQAGISVKCSGSFAAVSNTDWITISNKGSVSFAANTTGSVRNGQVTFTCGTLAKTVTFTQMPKLSVSLSSPILSSSSSSPTTVDLTGSGLTLEWNRVAGARSYSAVVQDPKGNRTYRYVTDDGSARFQITLDKSEFDPANKSSYKVWLYAYDQYANQYSSGYYYCVNADGDLVLVNGVTAAVWTDVSDLGSSTNINVVSTGNWTAASDPWLTLSANSGASGAVLTITASANSGSTRTGTVSIACGGSTATLTVSQYAALDAAPVLLTPGLDFNLGAPQAIALNNGSLAVTWKAEPQVRYYDVYITAVTSGVHLYSSGHLRNGAGSYTFTGLDLEPGQIYQLNLKRTLNESRSGVYSASAYYFTLIPAEPFLTVTASDASSNELIFDAIGEENHQRYRVSASGTWYVESSDADWLLVGRQSYTQDYLDRYDYLPEDFEYYVTSTENDFYISVLENETGNTRMGSVTVSTPGADPVVIQVVQEESYDLPLITSPSVSTKPSQATTLPVGTLRLTWSAGSGNTGVYGVTLYEKQGNSYISVYSRSNLTVRSLTIPSGVLTDGTEYRLRLETDLAGSGASVYKNFYFTATLESPLSLTIQTDWGKALAGSVTVDAAASGGTGGYQYAYQLLLDSQVISESMVGCYTHYTFPIATGNYSVRVYAQDSTGQQVSQTSASFEIDGNVLSLLTNTQTYIEVDDLRQSMEYQVVTTGGEWTVDSAPSWISLNADNGRNGDSLLITVGQNDSVRRVGVIVLSSNFRVASLTVTQHGETGVSLNQKEAILDHTARKTAFTFQASSQWTAATQANWITLDTAKGAAGEGRLNYNVTANSGDEPRIGIITVSSDGKSQRFTVIQNPYVEQIVFGFTPDKTTAEVGEEITFTILHDQDTQALRLLVDGDIYEEITVRGTQTTFVRAFNSSGNRSVAFQRKSDGEWSDQTTSAVLNITKIDNLHMPQVTYQATGFAGYPMEVKIAQVDQANQYHIRVNDPDGNLLVYLPLTAEELAAQDQTVSIDGAYLRQAGTYAISVMATGYGYSQSEFQGSFTLEKQVFDANIILPRSGDQFVTGGKIHVDVEQSGGGYMNVKILDTAGHVMAEYPENQNHLTGDDELYRVYTAEKTGKFTVVVSVYPMNTAEEYNTEPIQVSTEVEVVGPNVNRMNLAGPKTGYTWIEGTENKLYICANDATESAQVILDGRTLLDTPSEDYTSVEWERQFVIPLGELQPGRHTVKAIVYDHDLVSDEGNYASSDMTKTFYYAKKLTDTYLVYPLSSDVKLMQSPMSSIALDAHVVGGIYVQPLVVTYEAGDWLKVRTLQNEEGFVKLSQVSRKAPETAEKRLVILSPVNGQIIDEANTSLTVEWASGLALPENPVVTITLAVPSAGPDVKATSTRRGYGPFPLDLSDFKYMDFELTLSVVDNDGTTHSDSVSFLVDTLTDEEKYKQWFSDTIANNINEYDSKYCMVEPLPSSTVFGRTEWMNKALNGGYLEESSHLLPVLNFKQGFNFVTEGQDATESARLTVISNAMKDRTVAARFTQSDDSTKAMIRAKSENAIREQRVRTINSALKASIDVACTVIDTVILIEGGATADKAQKVKDVLKNIVKNVVDGVDAVVTELVASYDAEVLTAAYVSVYRDAIIEACDEYVEYLEVAYFGGKGKAATMNGAMTYNQAAAKEYITVFQRYREEVAKIPDGLKLTDIEAMKENNVALDNAVKDLLEYSGIKNVSLYTLTTASVDFTQAIINGLPKAIEKFLDTYLEYLTDCFMEGVFDQDSTFMQEHPVLSSIPASSLRSSVIRWLKKLIEIDISKNPAININWDAFTKAIAKDAAGWGVTLGPELLILAIASGMENAVKKGDVSGPIKMSKGVINTGKFKDLEPGFVKAIHGAISGAWKTGTSIAGFLGNLSLLSAENNGLTTFKTYATLFYIAKQFRRDVAMKQIYKYSGAYMVIILRDMVNKATVAELERLRASMITISLLDIDSLEYFKEMKKVHNNNKAWEIRGGEATFKYDMYPSDSDISATQSSLEQFLKVFTTVPAEIQQYLNTLN